MYVIMDSSFLIEMISLGKDVLALAEEVLGIPIKPVILSGVERELRVLAKRPGLIGIRARGALEISGKYAFLDIPMEPGESVDDYIVRIAKKFVWPVATNDGGLRKKLREAGIPHIFLRSDGSVGVYGEVEMK